MTVYFSTAVRLSQTYIVTEDLSVAAESLPPEAIAQQNDVLMPWPVLIVREQARKADRPRASERDST